MAISSIDNVITGTFIRRFQGLLVGASSNPLQNNASKVTIADGLRLGARTFAAAVQGLNATISFVNISHGTLSQLKKIVGQMIDLAKESSERGVGSDGRGDLDLQFKRLVDKFRSITDNTVIGGNDYLTKDGLSAILEKIGLDPNTVLSVKKLFDAFKIPKDNASLASETYKAPRPLDIPQSVYDAPVSKNIFRLQNISNTNGGIYTASRFESGIAYGASVYGAVDNSIGQNPGERAIFAADQNGTTTTQAAGSLVGANDVSGLLAVNRYDSSTDAAGYSIIRSTANLFNNNNPSNYEQLFMLDNHGAVVGQLTNNDGSSTYIDAEMSSKADTIAISSKHDDGAGTYTYEVYTVDSYSFGADPTALSTTSVDVKTTGDLPGYDNLAMSSDGTGVIYRYVDSANYYFVNAGASHGAIPADVDANCTPGFVGSSNQVAYVHGGNSIKVYNPDTLTATTVLAGINPSALATWQGDTGYFSFYDSAANTISLYSYDSTSGTATAVDMDGYSSGTSYALGSSDTVSRLTLAQRADGYMDVGIVGSLASTGDTDTELYRLTFNVQSVSGRRTEAASFETTKILDYSLATRPDAYRALLDLQKLEEQMTKNLAALDKMTDYIAENLDLSRAVGFAFLDLSNTVTSSDTDPEKIAEKLRIAIRQNAKGSLSQAENIQSIVIASLTYGAA